jgi:hypothetical protein
MPHLLSVEKKVTVKGYFSDARPPICNSFFAKSLWVELATGTYR